MSAVRVTVLVLTLLVLIWHNPEESRLSAAAHRAQIVSTISITYGQWSGAKLERKKDIVGFISVGLGTGWFGGQNALQYQLVNALGSMVQHHEISPLAASRLSLLSGAATPRFSRDATYYVRQIDAYYKTASIQKRLTPAELILMCLADSPPMGCANLLAGRSP
jgi:hypothetical protein